jgi:aarF domain-containing kinase
MIQVQVGLRQVAKGSVKIIGGSAVLGAAGVAAYTSTTQGRGMRRELQFWSGVAPVVFDYYWNFASSSPYVKYQKYITKGQEEFAREQKRQKLKAMNERHAVKIFSVMVDLRGLYIKLGQVLSVTALPIPEAYREKFRALQSDVPGWEAFEESVKPVLERELGRPIEQVFEFIDPVPCGAASIGQVHRAVLKDNDASASNDEHGNRQVVIKVQYPDAAWQIPADIQCVRDLVKICVFFGVIDESSANMSFNEFSRQFTAELDYDQEKRNLQDIYQSSLDPDAPYQRLGVIVPHVYPELCTSKVITMSYLPGPKLEEEARRQLKALGIDTSKDIRSLLRSRTSGTENETTSVRNEVAKQGMDTEEENHKRPDSALGGWQRQAIKIGSKIVSVDSFLGTVRLASRVQLWCTAATVKSINLISNTPVLGSLVPSSLFAWAENHATASQQAERMALTKQWIDALFEVHAHQIFSLGCFNADAHPGNILVVEEDGSAAPKLGLIDFGQCKRLTPSEQARVARLIVSVANKESDETIAAAFRELGIQTKNDSTDFLAKLAKLMFGPLQSYHIDPSWHKELHKQDDVTYFPTELSMVYRTSMLLRGLAFSLQFNVAVADLWKDQAQEALGRIDALAVIDERRNESKTAHKVLVRRITTDELTDLQDHASLAPVQIE